MTWIQRLRNKKENGKSAGEPVLSASAQETVANTYEVDIAPDDPLLAYILSSPGILQIDRLNLDSPALRNLKEAKVRLSVPLISQGELIGLLNLGPRLSEADYSTDDFHLLSTLATQAAPALRVAQLARQQQLEARELERMEQELRVARVVQQTLLPQAVPTLKGWKIAAHWEPARTVSGDFYDFIPLPDGRLGFVIADVTDKGVPAALVMATSRSVLRSVAEHGASPEAVLKQANDLLCPTMPNSMFVTCLYALLDPQSGLLRYANAGHNPPYQHTANHIIELRARGMPLGLFPKMVYEEKQTYLNPGDSVVMYSDGLVEAHDPQGEMFGYPRLRELMALPQCGDELIQCMLNELHSFTGPDWEQEDDVTFVTLDHLPQDDQDPPESRRGVHTDAPATQNDFDPTRSDPVLDTFTLPSRIGGERQALEKLEAVLTPLHLETGKVERLKTAVAEATMNAMEHGNHYQEDKPVTIRVLASEDRVVVQIEDLGGEVPIQPVEAPDLEAKLEGLQSPRGWGLFLIQNMVDELITRTEGERHIIELVIKR